MIYTNKTKSIEYSIVEKKSRNKHPFVIVAEDKHHVCAMDMGRFETRELAVKAIERFIK